MMNTFGETLQQIILHSGVKYATIANAVEYDISYISKWVNGKTLPSPKNIEMISTNIPDTIIKFSQKENISAMLLEYHCSNEDELAKTLHDLLYYSFHRAMDNSKSVRDILFDSSPSALHVATTIFSCYTTGNCLTVVDIFSLDHKTALLIAGIKEGRFAAPKSTNIRHDMLIDLEHIADDEIIYKIVFLIHMLTCMSGIEFHLYADHWASNKIIFMNDSHNVIISGFIMEKKIIAATQTTDVINRELLWNSIISKMSQKTEVFKKTTMQEMLRNNIYIRSIISTNIKWLLGHITEHLLPEDVLEKLDSEIKGQLTDCDIRNLQNISHKIIIQPDTYILLYESALSDFIISGEIDFFNHPLFLTVKQRKSCIDFLLNCIKSTNIRLICDGFSTDFRLITNPCMFISDSVYYLRLENGRYEDNLLLLQDVKIQQLFDRFYNAAWNDRADVVLDDQSKIIDKIKHYQAKLELLIN